MSEVNVEQKYVDFIESLVEQISPLLPEDVNKLQEDYLVSNIRHSAMLLAQSMQEDKVFGSLNFETQCTYIQIMAEWSFHKEIDLFRSGIPAKYWKVVMQKIWFTMWEVMYACIQNDAPETVVLNLVERYVSVTYEDAVEELKADEIIDDETEEKAKEQSNISIMAEEYKKKRMKEKFNNMIYTIFLLIMICVTIAFLIVKFQTIGIIIVLSFLVIYNIFPLKKG